MKTFIDFTYYVTGVHSPDSVKWASENGHQLDNARRFDGEGSKQPWRRFLETCNEKTMEPNAGVLIADDIELPGDGAMVIALALDYLGKKPLVLPSQGRMLAGVSMGPESLAPLKEYAKANRMKPSRGH